MLYTVTAGKMPKVDCRNFTDHFLFQCACQKIFFRKGRYLDKYHPASCKQIHHPRHFYPAHQCKSPLAGSPEAERECRVPQEMTCNGLTRKHFSRLQPRCHVAQVQHKSHQSCVYHREGYDQGT